MRAWGLACLALAGCALFSAAPGAKPAVPVTPAAVPAEELFAVCWPADAAPTQRVTLAFLASGDVMFDNRDGASPSVGRCLREIAASYPWATAPHQLEVAPPPKRATGWAVLEWVRLLDQGRFTSSRGLVDPAPLVARCLGLGQGIRTGLSFKVTPSPVHVVSLLKDQVPVSASTDAERCVEAVLGATAWPNTRPALFDLEAPAPIAPQGDVRQYQLEPGELPVLAPALVRDAMASLQPGVSACWEAALARRAGLSGARSFRFKTGADGAVKSLAVAPELGQPAAADYLLDACLAEVLRAARIPGAGLGLGGYSWLFADRAAQ
ncbi:MAG: hypothetical protein K1X89_27180 [Myxococcaceae bacterium]|nr:hypothetical protein [Myxococcaceae bacterium]